MSKKNRNIILLIVASQIVLILGFIALPVVVQSIPGRYRVALQERIPLASTILEGVIDGVAPMPETLPVAHAQETGEEVDIHSLIAVEPETPPTVAPTAVVKPGIDSEENVEAASTTETIAAESTPLPTQTPLPQPTVPPTPVPLPATHSLEGMGVIRQTFNNCGPANLTQVLNWYGNDITQEELASFLKPNSEDRNVSPWQIADFVNEQTAGAFRATAHSGGNIELLKTFIAAGYPVVIEKGYNLESSGWWGHYLTVYAYDDEQQQFLTQDSYLGPWDGSGRTASYEEVENFWPQFNHTFYVVYQPEQEEEVYSILGPDMLDQQAMWRNVATTAQEQVDTNPEDAFTWFNLGTSLTRLGELSGEQQFYQGGAQAFDQARSLGLPPRMLWYQHRPYVAYDKVGRYQDVVDLANSTLETQGGRNVEETYWYKGHALAALGDLFGAQEAYQSALAINQNFYPAQISLDWVTSLISG